MHWYDGTWWGHMGMMWIWVLFGLLLVGGLLFLLFRGGAALANRGVRERDDDDPESIVKRRYARGEIGEDEMKRRLRELHGS